MRVGFAYLGTLGEGGIGEGICFLYVYEDVSTSIAWCGPACLSCRLWLGSTGEFLGERWQMSFRQLNESIGAN